MVVPCYNEERRVDIEAFRALAATDGLVVLFVDDGSTDGTPSVLGRMAEQCASIDMLVLPTNSGKAEAVRQGLLAAIDSGVRVVGYLDADLATPASELIRMLGLLEADSTLTAVFGSRVARLGSTIERSLFRHYTGRVFATVASIALGVAVYDTQCGAKIFRVTPNLIDALAEPFRSPWSFDVLLFERLMNGTEGRAGLPVSSFLEMPLIVWRDRPGSKLDLGGSILALADVVRLAVSRRRRR
ncbi:MAG: glycosyltransferase [Acidimicrobiales bacterium]